MLNLEKSLEAFEEAKTLMPGGVNSPVRSYRNVDCNPPFIARGEGAHIFDIDGNEYVDYVLSWGPLVAGHAHPAVVSALADAAQATARRRHSNPTSCALCRRPILPCSSCAWSTRARKRR